MFGYSFFRLSQLGVLALAKVVVRITPGVKDDAIFNYIDKIIDAIIPNNE